MFRLLRGKGAKVLGAALIMASTLAAVSGPGSPASAEPSIPAFLDPTKLPICEKPGPQEPSSAPPKSIHDPTAYHCAMTPARAGLSFKGADNNKFLRLDQTKALQFERRNGGGTADGPNLDACSPSCRNAILESVASGNRYGIGATLEAQEPLLRGEKQLVYNWVGLQTLNQFSNGQLVQIGIINNTYPANFCADNKNEKYRSLIIVQARINGSYSPKICFPEYHFGFGSWTDFAVTYNGGGWWNVWVNWAGQWHALLGWHIPNLTGGNAVGVVEAAEVKVQSGQPDPFIGDINDRWIQLNWGGADWRKWDDGVPTEQFSKTPPYCFNSVYTIDQTRVNAWDCP